MIKNKNIIFILFTLIVIIGCNAKEKTADYRSGTDGLIMNFLSGAPPSKIYADSEQVEIPISIEVRNKGAYPTPDDEDGWSDDSIIFISGFDTEIISSWEIGDKEAEKINEKHPFVNLIEKAEVLEGKYISNPEGGYELLEFIGTANLGRIKAEKYTPNFLVTACYGYKTKANPSVCIDPRPFTTIKENKVCNIHDISLKNQGAPVAITKVESKALSNSIEFKIYFKNIGKGDVIAIDNLLKCSGQGDRLGNYDDNANKKNLGKSDMDFVKIVEVKVGEESIKENCRQLLEVGNNQDYARLINNEGFIVCDLKDYKKDTESAYTTPLYVEIAYGYRAAISKEVEIVRVPELK